MEKDVIRTNKNRELTELAFLKAVDDLIEEDGFENLGVNAVAAKAGLSKMLIYLEENCPVYNGFKLQSETGWEQLEKGIDGLVDQWIKNYTNE